MYVKLTNIQYAILCDTILKNRIRLSVTMRFVNDTKMYYIERDSIYTKYIRIRHTTRVETTTYSYLDVLRYIKILSHEPENHTHLR